MRCSASLLTHTNSFHSSTLFPPRLLQRLAPASEPLMGHCIGADDYLRNDSISTGIELTRRVGLEALGSANQENPAARD